MLQRGFSILFHINVFDYFVTPREFRGNSPNFSAVTVASDYRRRTVSAKRVTDSSVAAAGRHQLFGSDPTLAS